MAIEGQNDIMTFLAVLTQYMRRLEAAGCPVRDQNAQRVLLSGLDQDIFETFISSCVRHPYTSYNQLQKALEETAAQPRMIAKLRALKPGNPQSALPTRTVMQQQQQQPPSASSQRMDKIESILVSLVQAQLPKKRPVCFKFEKGECPYGDKCRFEHAPSNKNSNKQNNNTDNTKQSKYCPLHKSTHHDASECNALRNDPSLKTALGTTAPDGQSVNATVHTPNGYSFMFPTRASVPHHIFAMRGAPKIDLWCVDGAATTFATYDRSKCFNIRPCNVAIFGPNSKDDSFTGTKMGDAHICVVDKATGDSNMMLVSDVLISEAFPFHIFSEILAFEKKCTAAKSLGSWQF